MEENQLMEFLRICGLNLYEAKVYLNLLKFGRVSRSEVYKIAQIPQNRVYDILTALVNKELVIVVENQTIVPRNPRGLLNSTAYLDSKERISRRHEALRKESEDIEFKVSLVRQEQQAVKELIGMYDTPSVQHPIAQRFLDVFQGAQEEILCLTTLPILYPSGQFYSEVLKAVDRGVVYRRVLGHDYVLAQGAKSITADAKRGIRIRVAPESVIQEKYYVVDGSTVFLRALKTTLSAENEEAFIFHQPEIVGAYRKSFNALWEHSEELDAFLKRVQKAIAGHAKARDILRQVFEKGRLDKEQLSAGQEWSKEQVLELLAKGLLKDSEVRGLLIIDAAALLG